MIVVTTPGDKSPGWKLKPGSSSPLKQAILIIAGFSLLQLIALKFISGRK